MSRHQVRLLILLVVGLFSTQIDGALLKAQAVRSPIAKVIRLLEEIQKQLNKESKEDEDTFKKYKCWCKKNEDEKREAISTTKTELKDTEAYMEKSAAEEAMLATEIEQLREDIAAARKSMVEATSVRENEKKQYVLENEEGKKSMYALQRAIDTLKRATFLQQQGQYQSHEAQSSHSVLYQVQQELELKFSKFTGNTQKSFAGVLGALEELVRQSGSSSGEFHGHQVVAAIQKATGGNAYNPASQTIIGIMQSMRDEFKKDLAEGKETEAEAQASYKKLMTDKQGEIAAAESSLDTKLEKHQEVRLKRAQASRSIKRLDAAITKDDNFLKSILPDCQDEAKDYVKRQAARVEEGKAIDATLKILTEDTNRELLRKMSFLQVSKTTSTNLLASKVARRHRNMKALSFLSVKTLTATLTKNGISDFKYVKKEIDKAVKDVKKQKQAQADKKAQCLLSIDETEDDLKVAQHEQKALQTKIAVAVEDISTLQDQIVALKKEITDSQESLAEVTKERQEGEKLYQTSLADAKATVQILEKAMTKLQMFYGSFVQVEAKQPENNVGESNYEKPEKSKAYSKSSNAGGVMQLLTSIIKDAEKSELELKLGEERAVQVYRRTVKETRIAMDDSTRNVEMKEGQIAKTKSQQADFDAALTAQVAKVQRIDTLLKAHHRECDDLLANFRKYQKAFDNDIEAYADVKASLSGATI
eukprot:TRINITY_DN67569_c0_g1_i1.p1 TRINITY_DN67569_c0_g1~~TRINITY_DN67569_c0_g1_i1.p1  ORF type:complete len:705 (-),score=201.24 TRINITY_DN67569_c0_g1_i1:202-2316(-)